MLLLGVAMSLIKAFSKNFPRKTVKILKILHMVDAVNNQILAFTSILASTLAQYIGLGLVHASQSLK